MQLKRGTLILLITIVLLLALGTLIEFENIGRTINTYLITSNTFSEGDRTKSWQTYTNEEYGFSVKFPSEWGDIAGQNDGAAVAKPGIILDYEKAKSCVSNEEYIQKSLVPNYAEGYQVDKLPNSSLSGLVAKSSQAEQSEYYTEAYIVNCPQVIRLGYYSEGIENKEQVFKDILASVKTWQPNQ